MHALPEWVEQLIDRYEHKASEARGFARRMSRQKHNVALASTNVEAGLYETFARDLRNAWQSEAEVVATDYDRLRMALEALLIEFHKPYTKPNNDTLLFCDVPIPQSSIRILLKQFPARFPPKLVEDP